MTRFLKIGHRGFNLSEIVSWHDKPGGRNEFYLVTTGHEDNGTCFIDAEADALRAFFRCMISNPSQVVEQLPIVLDITPTPASEPADNSVLIETKEGMIRFVPTPVAPREGVL